VDGATQRTRYTFFIPVVTGLLALADIIEQPSRRQKN
jgi:hypothetical protein